MRKKILVREAGLVDFFKSFFQAKADGKESQWLQRLRKADSGLADMWSDFDDKVSQSMWSQKKRLQARGLDSSHIDKIIKQYGLKNS